MKQTICVLLLVSITLLTSCSKDDDVIPEEIVGNIKDVTKCDLNITPDTFIAICSDGTDVASPNEIIKFASAFYYRWDHSIHTKFTWTVESGSMRIVKVENIVDGIIARSIVTVLFYPDFSGNGELKGKAEGFGASAATTRKIELESIE